MKTQRTRPRQRGERGFVLVVVVVLLAALSVITAARLEVLRSESGTTSRAEEELVARAFAEACMEKAHALVEGYAEHTAPPAHERPPVDFDGLLDPDPSIAGDEFIPGSPWVRVSLGLGGAMRRFGLLRQDQTESSSRVQCLLRFDDNQDDGPPNDARRQPGATSNTAGVREGPEAAGVDVPLRDRDRSIVVTAIGVAPFFAAGAVGDEEVYAQGHARVTLKRYFQSRGAPALFAGGDATLNENVAICGSGGIQADNTSFANGSCACGTVVGGTAPSGPSCADDPNDGCATCDEFGVQPTGPQPAPPPAPASAFTMAALSSYVDGPAATMGAAGACRFFMAAKTAATPAVVFVWDRTQPACATAAPDPVPPPCAYDASRFPTIGALTDAQSPVPAPATCPSPRSCWRPVFVDDGWGYAWEQTSALVSGAVASEKLRFDDARFAYWSTMAPGQRPLENPDTLPAATWEALCTGRATGRSITPRPLFFWGSGGVPRWRMNAANRDDVPWPAVFASDGELIVDDHVGSTTPVVARLMSTKRITMEQSVRLCCPTCRCDSVSATTPPCSGADAAVQGFFGVAGPIPPIPSPMLDRVLASEDRCSALNDVGLYGRVHCASFDAQNGACALGGVTTFGALPPGTTCDAGSGTVCNTDIGMCLKNNASVVGEVIGQHAVCLNNNASVAGVVWTNGDVYFENNAVITGQIVAGADIVLDHNSRVTFAGTSDIGGGAISVAWSEATW